MSDCPDHFVLICTTCLGGTDASDIRATLSEHLPDGYAIRAIDCLAGCNQPRTVGFQATGKASYLFGDIESDDDIAAIGQFAIQYRQSETGWTSATDRPPALFEKTLARLPALTKGVGS